MPFAATWMDLESVILSEISTRKRNIILRKQKETHRLWKWTYDCWRGGIVRDFGKVMHTLQHLKWMTNKDLLYSTWKSVQCYGSAFMGGWLEEQMDTGTGMTESLYCSPETITTLLISYTPIQNKSLKFGGKQKKAGRGPRKTFFEEYIQMANKYMKRGSISLNSRGMKVKTQWDITSELLEWQLFKKTRDNRSAGEDAEKRKPLYTVNENVNWYSCYRKQYRGSSKSEN